MMMTMILATACGEEEAPAPEPKEPVAADPADDGDDDEMQKGGSGSSPLDAFSIEAGIFEGAAKAADGDDANFKGSGDDWQRATDLP